MHVHSDRLGREIRLPDFLIVGAAKSGTTSLYQYLRNAPAVAMPERKEPLFFVFDGVGPKYHLCNGATVSGLGCTLEEYVGYFEALPADRCVGEASTWYLYRHEEVIRNLEKTYGARVSDLRIVMVLRNPVDRAWSQYGMSEREGLENLPFEEAIRPEVIGRRLSEGMDPGYDYLGFGRYYGQVKAYKDRFPHVRVFLYDDLNADGSGLVREMLEFLGVEVAGASGPVGRLNTSGAPRSALGRLADRVIFKSNPLKTMLRPLVPPSLRRTLKWKASALIYRKRQMPDGVRRRLADAFREDIVQLQGLIGRDLSSWLAD